MTADEAERRALEAAVELQGLLTAVEIPAEFDLANRNDKHQVVVGRRGREGTA